MKKSGLQLTGYGKCYFLNFCLFHFPKFQMTDVKNVYGTILFHNGFRGFL